MINWNDNRGSTMILVIWAIGILSAIAAFLVYRAEVEWAVMASLERDLAARQLATAVLNERLDLLLADDNAYDTPDEAWYGKTGVSVFERDGYQVRLIIEDEGSKPNINLLGAETWELLLEDKSDIDILLDWIDPDDDPRMEGAEKEHYQSLSPGYLPRNGFLASLEELKQLKNGDGLYEMIAPHCTVYGRFNPNTLTREQFENLMLSYGIERRLAERMAEDFSAYRSKNRFENMEQLLQLPSVTLQTLDRIKPLFEFTGQCNVNFVGETGLRLTLKRAGYDPGLAAELVSKRREDPFDTMEEVQAFFRNRRKEIRAEDFFTVRSSVFKIRIWLIKGNHRYYLETVQRRKETDRIGIPWEMQVLSWRFLMNEEAPEIPDIVSFGEEENDG